MGNWTPVYSTEQRHAIETAALSGRLSLAEIQRRAENGRLDSQLEPFTIPYSSVAYIARAAKKRRAGKDKSPLATMPAADANEHIRQRLLSLADRELTALESRKGKGDPKLAKEWARCVREAAAIPGKEQRRLNRTIDTASRSPHRQHPRQQHPRHHT